jgi:DNA-binding SARP family transcriptional activator/TolB-like protein
MRAAPGVRVRLLGRFAVAIDGEPLTPLRISSRKGRALLAFLAMHPEHSASREELATLLWGDRPDQQARLSLRQCILSLRAALAEADDILVLEGDTVALQMDRVWVDAVCFKRFAQSAAAADLESAADLYGGELLADVKIEAEGFFAWLDQERAALTAVAARVFESWTVALDNAGRGQQAIAAAERLVALDPLREAWHRILLRVYARHQGRDAALARAKTLMALLKTELQVEPEQATSALVGDIRNGTFGSAEPAQTRPWNALESAEKGLPAELDHAPLSPYHGGDQATSILATDVPTGILEKQTRPASSSRRNFRMIALLIVLLATFAAIAFARLHFFASSAKETAFLLPVPVAVLSFESLDRTDRSRALAERLSDELVNVLSRITVVQVTSRLKPGQKTRPSKDVMAIGDQLGVRYLLDGTVRIEDDRLHLNVELIDTRTGLHVWSNQFEEGPAEARETQQLVVRGLGRALEVEMAYLNSGFIAKGPSQLRTTEEMLAAGWSAIYASAASSSLPQAEASFREVLQREPDRIPAMLGLAAHHIIAVGNLFVPEREPYLDQADDLLGRILLRSPDSSAAHYYRGLSQKLRGEMQLALTSFTRSAALNPSFAPAYGQIGQVLTSLGRALEGLDQIRYAMRLSPQDPTMPSWDAFAAEAELELEHDAEAIQWLLRAVALSPNSRYANGELAAAYALAGDRARAELYARKFKALTEGVSNDRRLELFGASLPPPSRHRTADGLRLALGDAS